MDKQLKVAFDTSAWRALGVSGAKRLQAFLAANPNAAKRIQIWETVPTIFETTWDWMKDGKTHVPSLMAAEKLALCEGRIVPSPHLVIQRAIADHFSLQRPSIDTEIRLFNALLERMKDQEFVESDDFSKALIDSVKIARQQYMDAFEALARILTDASGDKSRTPGLVDTLFEQADIRAQLAAGLSERFNLPSQLRTHMALFSAWEQIEHTRRVVEFYKAKLAARMERGVVAKLSDFLDFEILICGTRLDRLITLNTNDFQGFNLPSLSGKLWTLVEFKDYLGWKDDKTVPRAAP